MITAAALLVDSVVRHRDEHWVSLCLKVDDVTGRWEQTSNEMSLFNAEVDDLLRRGAEVLWTPSDRARCTVCWRAIRLTRAGRLYRHGFPGMPANICPGTGAPPRAEEQDS